MTPLMPYGCWHQRCLGTPGVTAYRAVAGLVQELVERTDAKHAQPAIAACITAGGRERMRQLRRVAGEDTVAYQDTDSLIVERVGWERLVRKGEHSQTRLGSLKLLGEYDRVAVWGVRRYELGDRLIASGVERGQGVRDDHTYSRLDWESLQSQLACGPVGTVGFRRRVVRLGDMDIPGHLTEDGRILPLTLDEEM
jgi:hypothetical protein